MCGTSSESRAHHATAAETHRTYFDFDVWDAVSALLASLDYVSMSSLAGFAPLIGRSTVVLYLQHSKTIIAETPLFLQK